MNIALNFWPSSKKEFIKNQNRQIKMNWFFFEAIKPAVMQQCPVSFLHVLKDGEKSKYFA